jgi:lipopolysaccharide/colanic/teichoic acid biosynthesis glycosyltransferase
MRRLARVLLYGGAAGIVVGLGRYHAQFIGHYYFHSAERLPWNLTYAALLCLCAYGMGLPDLDLKRSPWASAFSASLSAAVLVSIIQIALGSLLLPRFVVFSAVLLATPWFAVCVGVADIGRERGEDRDRVILVAGPEEHAALCADLEREPERPVSLAAWVVPDDVHTEDPRSKPLVELVLERRGTMVVLDRTATVDETIVRQAATLHEAGLRVRSLSFFYDEWLGKLPLVELERMSLMFDLGELHRVRYGRMKRLVDLVVGAVGLVALMAAFPLVVAGDVIANRGPLLYRQTRVGRGSRSFEILKFRTMRPEGVGAEWTAERDARVTPWGRVLRRTHIDELPQVINILRGDQSVVGPRPEQPQYVAELRKKIPFYDLRHLVRPGLTGWAQVKYPYGADDHDAMEKLQYDFYYLRHQGLALDARIMARTVRSVAGLAGR